MPHNTQYDVLIVGAGPAGSATALQLANMGLNVAIVERHPFPRSHVGICLSDQTLTLLQYLGLGDAFDAAQYWRRNITAVSWGNDAMQLVPQPGFHVDRGTLDQALLEQARHAGVTVYQPARLLDSQSCNAAGWQVTIATEQGQQTLSGRFLVDASGRHSAFRTERVKDSPPLLAIHAHWQLTMPPEFDGLIESGTDAWLWYAQTTPDNAVISVFCDPRHNHAAPRGDLQLRYEQLLKQFHVLQLNQLGHQCTDPKGCDAASYHAADLISQQHIRVGDAAVSVDPLSSQGVHLALLSGIQAAVVVHTIVKKPENTALAQQFFHLRMAERVQRFANKTKNEYSRVSLVRPEAFWHARGGNMIVTEYTPPPIVPELSLPPIPVSVSSQVSIETAPVLNGNFVEAQSVLKHPNLDSAIAYLDGVNLIELLAVLPQQLPCDAIPLLWQQYITPIMGRKIAAWLWEKRILVATS